MAVDETVVFVMLEAAAQMAVQVNLEVVVKVVGIGGVGGGSG